MARDEEMLVAQAKEMGFEDFARVLDYWKQLADPDGAEASDEERKASRNVFFESSLGGMWLGQMTLDPISGSIVASELNRLEHDLFEADCAQAKERLGRTARIDELARTSGQRRADALVEMATRSRTAPAEGIRPAPLFLSSSATRHSMAASVSSRTAPCSIPRPSTLGWTRPTSSGPSSAGQPGRRQRALPPVQRGDQKGHRTTRPHVHPPLLLRARRELPGRPHRDLRRRRRDHPGQRPPALRLPQPSAQPKRAPTRAPSPVRAAPVASDSASAHRRAPPEGAAAFWPSPPRQHPGRCHGRHFEKRSTPALWRARVSARPGFGAPMCRWGRVWRRTHASDGVRVGCRHRRRSVTCPFTNSAVRPVTPSSTSAGPWPMPTRRRAAPMATSVPGGCSPSSPRPDWRPSPAGGMCGAAPMAGGCGSGCACC